MTVDISHRAADISLPFRRLKNNSPQIETSFHDCRSILGARLLKLANFGVRVTRIDQEPFSASTEKVWVNTPWGGVYMLSWGDEIITRHHIQLLVLSVNETSRWNLLHWGIKSPETMLVDTWS